MTDAGDSDRLSLIVRSTAEPEALLLLLVRSIVQRDESLQALFNRFRAESKPVPWLADMLAAQMVVKVEEYSFRDIVGACQYLVDEYQQLGDGCFLVSQETGRVQLVVTADDLYDPGVLPRESGRTGQALLRLNPALETALVTHHHERAREVSTLSLLAGRSHPTELVREGGDRRLRIASRTGRTSLVKELSEEDPWTLLGRAGGTAALLLEHFQLADLAGRSEPENCARLEGVACCLSSLGLQDMTTVNLGYDRLGLLRSVVPRGWIRDIVRQLSHRAELDTKTDFSVEGLTDEIWQGQELWAVDPDVFDLARGAKARAIPIEGSATIGFSGCVGTLCIPHEFGVETREAHDRWTVTATLPYVLYVDLTKIQVLSLVGIARASTLAVGLH